MDSTARRIEWAPVVVGIIGVLIALFGVRSYYVRGDFGVMDAVRCALLLIPAALFLLVTSYVFHHARLVVLLMVFMGVVLVRGSPAFAVALGIALVAAVFGPAFRDWREARQSQGSAPET